MASRGDIDPVTGLPYDNTTKPPAATTATTTFQLPTLPGGAATFPTLPGRDLGDSYNYTGLDPQAAFNQAVQDLGMTPAQGRAGGLARVATWLNARGQSGWDASKTAGDYISQNGQGYDVIPAGDANWQWMQDNGSSGGGSAAPVQTTGSAGSQTDPALLAMLQQLIGQNTDTAKQNAERNTQLWNQIQGQIGQYSNSPVDANDPIIKAQTDAFRNNAQRGADTSQAALEEQRAYRGIPTGSADSGIAGANEAVGVNTGNFQAGKMADELNARRSQLAGYLSMGASMLSGDQSRALQSQIAAIDAQLRNISQTNQNTQFYDTLTNNMATQSNAYNTLLAQQLFGG